MANVSKLQELIRKQSELAAQIANDLAGDTLLTQVEQLKNENEALRANYAEVSAKAKALDSENAGLRETLQNQMRAERSRYVDQSKLKMEAYFGATAETDTDMLTRFERESKEKFARCRAMLNSETDETRTKFTAEIESLEKEIFDETKRLRQAHNAQAQAAASDYQNDSKGFEISAISKSTVEKITRASDDKMERAVGLNWLGRIGAVVILIGMIGMSQLFYQYLPNYMNCILMFVLASVVLGIGLFLNRKSKKQTVFSITMLSLGVALEYTALTVTYFVLGILNMWVALGICIIITSGSMFISLKIKNEIVASFAQIGGYLPIIAVVKALLNSDMTVLYGAMLYFLILNVLGFVLSSKYKWQALNYIAFGLNMIAVIIVSIGVGVLFYNEIGVETILTLVFMFISFALPTLLPLFTNIRIKTRFTVPDFILMTLATAINLILFYVMFHLYGLSDYTGLLSLFFAAFYFGLYFLVRKFFASDILVRALFWMTGIVFLTLFMPMHFDLKFISFGWFLQFAALVIYGILYERKMSFKVGAIGGAISLLFFILFDLILSKNMVNGFNVFIYKYAFLTLASLLIVAALVRKRKLVLGYLTADKQIYRDQAIRSAQLFAGAAYLNVTGFSIYLIYKIFDYAVPELIRTPGNVRYAMLVLMAAAMFAFAVFVPKAFKAVIARNVSVGLSVFSLLFLLIVNVVNRLPAFDSGGQVGEAVSATFLTAGIVIFSLYVFYDLVIKFYNLSKNRSHNWVIVSMATYFLFWFTFILMWHYRLEFINVAISIVYILTALACLAFGLYRRNSVTRRFALLLTGLAIAKIFVIDTWNLELKYRIINYLVFGTVLIGMSFLYQLYYKKIGKKDESTESRESEENTPPQMAAENPTEKIAKPIFCSDCGTRLVKDSEGNAYCPICGKSIK